MFLLITATFGVLFMAVFGLSLLVSPLNAAPFPLRSTHTQYQTRRLAAPQMSLEDLSGGFTAGKKKAKKVLILMSDTGGGHRASAQALDQALNETFPGKIDVDILDIWTKHATWPFNGFVPAYKFLANNPFLWRLSYAYAHFPPTRFATEVVSDFTSRSRFRRAMQESDPDMVVSVHPLCQHIPLPIVKEMNEKRNADKLPISFVTVVTDLGGAHDTWFDRGVDFCFVPSTAVKNIAQRCGLQAEQIVKHGLPVRPAFWRKAAPKEQLRDKLRLMKDRKTVLLMGGGDGVGGLGQIAEMVGERLGELKELRGEETQMVVICGNNKRVREELESRTWPRSVHVSVKGFCHNVDEFMGAADCLVTKAGPGTIAEAMTRGLPIVLSSFLPGQEAGNVPYVVDNGFGVYSGNVPRRIAEHVATIFSDEKQLKDMSEKSLTRSSSSATQNIAKDIGKIVLRRSVEMPELRSKYSK